MQKIPFKCQFNNTHHYPKLNLKKKSKFTNFLLKNINQKDVVQYA